YSRDRVTRSFKSMSFFSRIMTMTSKIAILARIRQFTAERAPQCAQFLRPSGPAEEFEDRQPWPHHSSTCQRPPAGLRFHAMEVVPMRRGMRYAIFAVALLGRAANASAKMTISSSAFAEKGSIPSKYPGDAQNPPSPPLEFSGIPGKAKSLVLLVEDPDV